MNKWDYFGSSHSSSAHQNCKDETNNDNRFGNLSCQCNFYFQKRWKCCGANAFSLVDEVKLQTPTFTVFTFHKSVGLIEVGNLHVLGIPQ